MSGLFKKRNRKFRQRESRNDSDEESGPVIIPDIKIKSEPKVSVPSEFEVSRGFGSSALSSKEKESKVDTSLPKPTTLLSFQDDEDGEVEVFKLKKSNYSRRLAKQREKERKKREAAFSFIKSEPTEIKDEKGQVYPTDSKDKAESWSSVYAGKEAEDMEVDSEEERERNNPFKNVLASGVIPDAATIYAMKKHRALAREMGDGFVPLDDKDKDEEKSRLIREDDNDHSEDDGEPSRINFTIDTGAVERQKLRDTFLSLQDGATKELETEDAAELDRWEREQIKKGVGVTQVGNMENSQMLASQMYSYSEEAPTYVPSHTHSAQPIPPPINLLNKSQETALTTEDIKARIAERLSSLKLLHHTHEQELEDCKHELIESSQLILNLNEEGPKIADNFALYQEMAAYVRDLVECFDMKVAHIDLLDGRMVDLYKSRAQKLAARRQMDVRDQADEFSSLSSEILKGVSIEYLAEKTSPMDEAKLRRAAEREGRRMRRRKKRERTAAIVKHQDGMSSDNEVPDTDIKYFKETRETIMREAETIFEDVVEDFGTLEGVMVNFERWKSTQLPSYCEAFVPLCLPKVFGAFVKLALLDWNPLQEERDFEKTRWFHQLVRYGVTYGAKEGEEDPDINLVPGIMERIVLPKITAYVQNVWSPVSQSETSRLVHLIRDLHDYYPTVNGKSKQLQNCLKAVIARINKTLDDDIFIPFYTRELIESRVLGASDFFQRQFWFTVKLLQNIVLWEGVIGESLLQHISLACLLNRYLLMGLSTSLTLKDTLDKCKTIVASIPKSWLKPLTETSTLPFLQPFSTFLLKFADSHHTLSMKKGISEEETKDVIKDIVHLLVTINSMDNAVSLAKKYSVSAFKK